MLLRTNCSSSAFEVGGAFCACAAAEEAEEVGGSCTAPGSAPDPPPPPDEEESHGFPVSMATGAEDWGLRSAEGQSGIIVKISREILRFFIRYLSATVCVQGFVDKWPCFNLCLLVYNGFM